MTERASEREREREREREKREMKESARSIDPSRAWSRIMALFIRVKLDVREFVSTSMCASSYNSFDNLSTP